MTRLGASQLSSVSCYLQLPLAAVRSPHEVLFGPVLVMDAEPLTACWDAFPLDVTTVSMLTPVAEFAGTNVQSPA
jgi:hypothetical protein